MDKVERIIKIKIIHLRVPCALLNRGLDTTRKIRKGDSRRLRLLFKQAEAIENKARHIKSAIITALIRRNIRAY